MFIDLCNGINIIKHKKIIEKEVKKDIEEKDDEDVEDSNNLIECIKNIRKYQDVYENTTSESSIKPESDNPIVKNLTILNEDDE